MSNNRLHNYINRVNKAAQPKKSPLEDFTAGEVAYIAHKLVGLSSASVKARAVATDAAVAFAADDTNRRFVCEIVARVTRDAATVDSHPLDVSPRVRGSDCVVVRNSLKNDGVTVMAPVKNLADCVKVVRKAYVTQGECAMEPFFPKETTIRMASGVVLPEKVGKLTYRKMVTSAIVDSMVAVNPASGHLRPAATVKNAATSACTIADASNVTTQFVAADSEPDYEMYRENPHFVYDSCMIDAGYLGRASSTCASQMKPVDILYKNAKNPLNHFAFPRTTKQVKYYPDPVKVLSRLRPALQPNTIGVIGAQVVDGLPLEKGLRKTMNKVRDIHIPPGSTIINLDSQDRTLARMAYKTLSDAEKVVITCKDSSQTHAEREKMIFNGEIIKGGVYCTSAKPPTCDTAIVVKVKSSTVSSGSDEKLIQACQIAAEADAHKCPEKGRFIARVHVYSLNGALYKKPSQEIARFDDQSKVWYYPSADLLSLNVLATNVDLDYTGLTRMNRAEAVAYVTHMALLAWKFPVARRVSPLIKIRVSAKGPVQEICAFPHVVFLPCGPGSYADVVSPLEAGDTTIDYDGLGLEPDEGDPPQPEVPAAPAAPPEEEPDYNDDDDSNLFDGV